MAGDLGRIRIPVGEAEVDVLAGGAGPPVLLLHGFPETRRAWEQPARRLQRDFTVVLADLPGYGDSAAPPIDPAHENYTNRSLAGILVEVMGRLGFERFGLAGHDRGGRVAYRMALDHPELVTGVALLDILPTAAMADRVTFELAGRMVNWFLLSQPTPFPETLILHDPAFYLEHILDSWAGDRLAISASARAEYLHAFRKPGVVATICEEYRASALDLEHDRLDRAQGRRIECPVLILWAETGLTGAFGPPLEIWGEWARDLTGRAIDAGHFLLEEAPDEVAAELRAFFSRAAPPADGRRFGGATTRSDGA